MQALATGAVSGAQTTRVNLEVGATRRDARIRFLKARVEILRRKLGGNRVIPSPDDRPRLLAIGQELNHAVADVTHLSLERKAPVPRQIESPERGTVIAIPHVGGLHHRYTRAA